MSARSHDHRSDCPDLQPTTRATTASPVAATAGNAARQSSLALPAADTDEQSWLGQTLDGVKDWLTGEDDPSTDFWAAWETRPADRRALVFRACEEGTIDAVIAPRATSAYELDITPGEEDLDLVLDYAQQHATIARSGMTWDELAGAQAAWMEQLARQAAEAEHGPAVSDAQVQTAHQADVAQQSYIQPREEVTWLTMSPQERADLVVRATQAIDAVVAVAAEQHPELELDASRFVLDFYTAESRGALAFTRNDGLCYIGAAAVEQIETNPRAFLSNVVHEVAAHREFNQGETVQWELYQRSAAQMAGYDPAAVSPDERRAERRRFHYFESEISAQVREHAFQVACEGPLCAETSAEAMLARLLPEVEAQWSPELLEPLMAGLLLRFELDPRIPPESSERFRACVHHELWIEL